MRQTQIPMLTILPKYVFCIQGCHTNPPQARIAGSHQLCLHSQLSASTSAQLLSPDRHLNTAALVSLERWKEKEELRCTRQTPKRKLVGKKKKTDKKVSEIKTDYTIKGLIQKI